MNTVDTNQSAAKPLTGTDSQFLKTSLMKLAQNDGEVQGPPALSATPTMSALLHALKRRWLLAVGLAFGAAAATVASVFYLLPPKYIVAVSVHIAKQPGVEEGNHAIFTANMEARVKSWPVLNAALNEKTADGRDIKDLEIVRGKGMGAVEWLQKSLKTDYKLGPEVLRVTLAADQPEETAELVNAISRAFLTGYSETDRTKKSQRLKELRDKKESIERKLSSLRKLYQAKIEALDVKDREAATVQQNQWLNKLGAAYASQRNNEDELIKAENEIIFGNARLKSLDKQEAPDEFLFEWYARDPGIIGHLKRLAEVEDEIARIYREYNEPFATQKAIPLKKSRFEMRDAKKAREAQIKPDIDNMWRASIRKDLEKQIDIAMEKKQGHERRRDSLDKEVKDLDKKVKESGPTGVILPQHIQAIVDDIKSEEKSLETVAGEITRVDLEQPASRLTLLQPAGVPQDRDRSQQTKIAGAGGLGMFVLALFGVAFLEFRSRKIGEPGDVAQGLGMKVIGTVPAMPARPKKPSAQDTANEQLWHVQLQESMDAIRTVLLHHNRSEPLHVIMVTSASSGEGKTTLATQLAASLARAWKRTLVIDGDLRHPNTHRLFDVPQEPGLAEVLRGEVEPADAVRATPFSRLWVLPAGNGDAHAIQALAQDNVGTLFEHLKQQYDFIIIDAPPVLPVTDSLLLGQHVDGLLFAVLREVSRAPAIHAAQQKLAPLEVPTLGAVVLGAEEEFSDKNYRLALNGPVKA